MISFAIFLGSIVLVTATTGQTGDPDAYAENSTYFDKQRLSAMTNLTERIYVLKRDYNTSTPFDCLSAMKQNDYGNNTYEYELKARINGSFIAYNVTMIANTTGNHTEPNNAYYEENKGQGPIDHKLMTTDGSSCFLFAVAFESGKYGCLLAVTENATQSTPQECESVYSQQCGNESVTLYKSNCTTTDDGTTGYSA
ncbi:uncharacterized protein LOC119401431 [Rhipicephalus sanguineus]|uniref:uncharacterized protein LOC119401431 n=1 Tax=Rhipicephalus sanguineus TaxID=34632 RepID=UPI001895DA7D|nr:uncharacterized protein LOC119401431 [Rhipicephalus sanguineus]